MVREARPILSIPRSAGEIFLEIVAAAGLLLLVIVTAVKYASLPGRIPIHFNLGGAPDAHGGKWLLWVIVLFAVALYVGLSIAIRYPHRFNYLWPVTEANARRQYRIARIMVVTVKAEVTWLFCGLVWMMIRVGQGAAAGLGPVFLPAMVGLILLTAIVYLIAARWAK